MSRDTRDDRERPGTDAGRSDRAGIATARAAASRCRSTGLALPRADRREAVEFRDRVYHLRGSESRILETVGAFRVVPATDLMDGRSSPDAFKEDLRRLSTTKGLIERHTIPINRDATRVVVLTREGEGAARRPAGRGVRRSSAAVSRGPREAPRAGARRAALSPVSGGGRAPGGRRRAHHARRPRLRTEAGLSDVSQPARPSGGRRPAGRPRDVCRRALSCR